MTKKKQQPPERIAERLTGVAAALVRLRNNAEAAGLDPKHVKQLDDLHHEAWDLAARLDPEGGWR